MLVEDWAAQFHTLINDSKLSTSNFFWQSYRKNLPHCFISNSTYLKDSLPLSPSQSRLWARDTGSFCCEGSRQGDRGRVQGNSSRAKPGITRGWMVDDFTLRGKTMEAKREDVWPSLPGEVIWGWRRKEGVRRRRRRRRKRRRGGGYILRGLHQLCESLAGLSLYSACDKRKILKTVMTNFLLSYLNFSDFCLNWSHECEAIIRVKWLIKHSKSNRLFSWWTS